MKNIEAEEKYSENELIYISLICCVLFWVSFFESDNMAFLEHCIGIVIPVCLFIAVTTIGILSRQNRAKYIEMWREYERKYEEKK